MFTIAHAYKQKALVPSDAIDQEFLKASKFDLDAIFMTKDNVQVKLKFIGTWTVIEEPLFDAYCRELYNTSWYACYNTWQSRYRYISGVWNLVEMVKVC